MPTNYLLATAKHLLASTMVPIKSWWTDYMTCKNNTTFENYEEKLFEQYPEYKNNNTVFIINGNTINRKYTLEENKI